MLIVLRDIYKRLVFTLPSPFSYTHVKIRQLIVTDLQISCKLHQGCCKADIRMCSHCLFPVACCNKIGTSCYHLVTRFTRLMTVTDLLLVLPSSSTCLFTSTCEQFVTCRRYQTCWNNLSLLASSTMYKMITTCSRLVNNWEHTV